MRTITLMVVTTLQSSGCYFLASDHRVSSDKAPWSAPNQRVDFWQKKWPCQSTTGECFEWRSVDHQGKTVAFDRVAAEQYLLRHYWSEMLLWGFVGTLSSFTFNGRPELALEKWAANPQLAGEYCGTLPLSYSVVSYHPDVIMIVEDQLCASQRSVGLYSHRKSNVRNEAELRKLFLQSTPSVELSPETTHVRKEFHWRVKEDTSVKYVPEIAVIGGSGDENGRPEKAPAPRPPRIWMARMDLPDAAPVELTFDGNAANFGVGPSDLLVVQRLATSVVVTRTNVAASR